MAAPGSFMRIKIKKGLDVPIAGPPQQEISDGNAIHSVALLGPDTVDLKPRMAVKAGDRVRLGQTLFSDKQNPGINFTSPGCGIVQAVNRGERRVLQSVVVRLEGDDEEQFDATKPDRLRDLDGRHVRDMLLAAGLWSALRTRPYSKIPAADAKPDAIFVTAIDTNPLAADPAVVIRDAGASFEHGLLVLAALCDTPVFVCTAPDSDIPCPSDAQFRHAEFGGPHPAGLVGTHIHFLMPVSKQRAVWHIAYQDVIAVGRLFTSGRIPTDRIVAIGGPKVRNPRLVRTRAGASTKDLLINEYDGARLRVVSGSPLSGHRASGWGGWLGRYHTQVCVMDEGSPREFLSWMRPGVKKFSSTRAYLGHLLNRGRFPLTSSQNGSPRAMVSTGSFENVVPLDILPTPLLKALLVRDTDTAQALGCLELDEEDLALCSFVCNGKYEYGPHLRSSLHEIEVNG